MFELMAGSNARHATGKERSSTLGRAHNEQQKRAIDDKRRIGRNSGQTAEA